MLPVFVCLNSGSRYGHRMLMCSCGTRRWGGMVLPASRQFTQERASVDRGVVMKNSFLWGSIPLTSPEWRGYTNMHDSRLKREKKQRRKSVGRLSSSLVPGNLFSLNLMKGMKKTNGRTEKHARNKYRLSSFSYLLCYVHPKIGPKIWLGDGALHRWQGHMLTSQCVKDSHDLKPLPSNHWHPSSLP